MTATDTSDPAIGQPVSALDTPALWVDLDALEHNIATMARITREQGVDWRPHVKASKAPELAKRLIAGGAVGITCAKVGEAEVMVDGGVTNILIANEIVGPLKIARLVALAARATLCVAVNVGANRCGVTPERAPELAQLVLDLPGVHLRGLMGYEGHVMGMQPEDKEAESARAADILQQAIANLRAAGIEPRVVSGGGTGNYWIATVLGALTELQAGGGVLMDQTYGEQMKVPGHRQALFLTAQVISTAVAGRAIADAGWKSSGMHTGIPLVASPPGLSVAKLNAEHTILDRAADANVAPGDRVTMVPHYSDSTVLLHRRLFAVRNGIVEAVWPIAAAGMLQ